MLLLSSLGTLGGVGVDWVFSDRDEQFLDALACSNRKVTRHLHMESRPLMHEARASSASRANIAIILSIKCFLLSAYALVFTNWLTVLILLKNS